MTLTLKQLQGLQNAPNRTLRKVVATALRLTEQRDEANREAREAQERLAAKELEDQPKFLVVLHRDGYVEVYANDWHPVHIAQMPDLSNQDEAENYMLSKTPMQYRGLYEQGKRITAGHTAGCMNHTTYKLLQHTLKELELWRRIQDGMEQAVPQEAYGAANGCMEATGAGASNEPATAGLVE